MENGNRHPEKDGITKQPFCRNFSADGKSSISSNGDKLAARAARPEVSTADVRRKLRRDISPFSVLQPPSGELQEQDMILVRWLNRYNVALVPET